MKVPDDSKQRDPGFWLKVAIFCGTSPLIFGAAALIAFVRSDAAARSESLDTWTQVGVAGLVGGVALFCVGMVALWVYLIRGRRAGLVGAELSQNAILTFILLLANFPAALACIWIADGEFSRVHLYFVNDAMVAVEELSVTWPGGQQRVGDLSPGSTAHLSFYVSGDGTVDFTAQQAGEACAGDLIGYVTTNLGGVAEVSFTDDCEVTVKER